MNSQVYDMILLWVIWIILVFGISMSIDKMLRLILWNYVLIAIIIWINTFIEMLSFPELEFLQQYGFKNLALLSSFLNDYKQYIVIAIYFLLLTIIFLRSNLWITRVYWSIGKIILKIIFIPLLISSILATMMLVIFGNNIIEPTKLIEVSKTFNQDPFMQRLILLSPLILFIPWFLTILFSTHIWGINLAFFSFKKKASADSHHEESFEDHDSHDDHGHDNHGHH